MKHSGLLVLPIFLIIGCNQSTTSKPDSEDLLRGKEYGLISEVKGFEDFNSFTMAILDDNGQFALSHFKNADSDLFVLEGTVRTTDGTKNRALDYLQFNSGELGENFVVGGFCRVGTETDPQLIGMFSSNPPEEGDASIAIKVWRADHKTGKIVPVEMEGVLFYNEIND